MPVLNATRVARLLPLLLLGAVACEGERPDIPSADAETSPSGESEIAASDSSASRKGKPPPVLFAVPEFELTDERGNSLRDSDLKGRVWIANFMFTRCQATCPRQAEKLAELQRRVKNWPDWDRIRLLSISVDPEHDTPERLREYGESRQADPSHWKFLTGPRDELFRVSIEGFKLPASAGTEDGSGPITHSPRFILVDARGRVRGYYDSQVEDDCLNLLRDLREVLSEPDPDRALTHIGVPSEVFCATWLEERRAAQLATAGEIGVYHDLTFTDRAPESGIEFRNRVVADAARDFKFNHYDHANGIAVGDVDGDGLSDLYFLSQVGGNELWRNLGGGRFENITERAGVGLNGRVSVSASFADTDNDGDPDLFVTTTRFGNAFFENLGGGRFRDATTISGLSHSGHSSSAEFFDYDRDGRLDLFVTNVGAFTSDEIGYSGDPAKKEDPYFIGVKEAFGLHLVSDRSERSILYHNDGHNRFHDAGDEVGLSHHGWSGDATPIDLNDDGWIDLYVVNMQGNDEYYENQHGAGFAQRSEERFPRSPWGAMGIKSFDYDNDGRMDLYVTNMHADMWRSRILGRQEKLKTAPEVAPPDTYLRDRVPGASIFGNALFENRGEGPLEDVSDRVNAEMYWPWGLSVGDLNADGFLDVFITASMNLTYRYQVNSLLLNDRGKRFADAEFIVGVEPRRDNVTATEWFELDCSGADQDHPFAQNRAGRVVVWGAIGSRSSAIVDLDGDGDLDIVTNDFNSRPMLLISDLSARNPDFHYLKIELSGRRSNRDGLGAKVQVTAGGRTLTQVHDGQSGYLSQSSFPLYFGLGETAEADRIAISWPSGNRQVIEGPIQSNQKVLVVEDLGPVPEAENRAAD